MITIFEDSIDENKIIHNETFTIKIEVDVNPPLFVHNEIKFRLLLFSYQVRIDDQPSLFAGKIHAVIARSWNNRVKGRDLYDGLFYLSLQTKTIEETTHLTKASLIHLLEKRFDDIDYDLAKSDIRRFILKRYFLMT